MVAHGLLNLLVSFKSMAAGQNTILKFLSAIIWMHPEKTSIGRFFPLSIFFFFFFFWGGGGGDQSGGRYLSGDRGHQNEPP